MVTRRKPKVASKPALSEHFKNLDKGDRVSVVREKAFDAKFPKRLQGRTGEIEGKRGRIYIVRIKDQDKEKRFLINPIHLKKIKS